MMPRENLKILSKIKRMRDSETIKEIILSLPFAELEESQTGNFVYSGSGRIRINSRLYQASLHISLAKKTSMVRVIVPRAGIWMECGFDVEEVRREFNTAVKKAMN